ncbi:MAG TPA: hypothetical protein VLL82_14610, partial [Mycobacterium sp.]|nr:hypothetical protein [Mycobacterium sp.]
MRRAGLVIVAAFLALGTARLAAQNWSQGPSGGARQGTTSGAPAAAGTVGEFFSQTMDFNLSTTASVTSASPAVITWTAHPFTAACVSVGPKCVFAVVFVNITGGAGITALQNYFIDPASVTANTFRIATTVANALAGVDVNTTSSGSGLMVGASYYPTSATIQTMGGFQLTPG